MTQKPKTIELRVPLDAAIGAASALLKNYACYTGATTFLSVLLLELASAGVVELKRDRE
jgi:hypothetical protein